MRIKKSNNYALILQIDYQWNFYNKNSKKKKKLNDKYNDIIFVINKKNSTS